MIPNARRVLLSLIRLLVLTVLILLGASASSAQVVDGLDLVVDLESSSHVVAELAVGEFFAVHAVVDAFSAVTIQSYRIAIETDPSLLVVDVDLPPSVGFSLTSPFSEITVGFDGPRLVGDAPFVLATWTILRTGDADPTDPGFVRLAAFPDGDDSHYASTGPAHHFAPFVDLGQVFVGAAAPRMRHFLPSEPTLARDREYTVTWDGVGVSDVALDGVPVAPSGAQSFVASAARTHVLEWIEDGVSRADSLRIDVVDAPRFVLFEAEPPSPELPGTHRVHWRVEGAGGVWWLPENDFVSDRGVRAVGAPTATPVVLRAENEWGTTYASIVLAGDGSPVIAAFEAPVTAIDRGESVDLFWAVNDAETVVLQPLGIEVDLVGSITVTPEVTTTYTLVATGDGPDATADLEVEVVPLRIVDFSLSPQVRSASEPLTVHWNVINADSIWIEPDVGPVFEAEGSVELFPEEVHPYTLNAQWGTHLRTETREWEFDLPTAALDILDLTPRPILRVRARVANADSARVTPGGDTFMVPVDGVYEVDTLVERLASDGWYTLTAWNESGSAQARYHWINREPIVQTLAPYSRSGVEVLGTQWIWYARTRLALDARVEFSWDGRVAPLEVDVQSYRPIQFWATTPGVVRIVAENDAHTVADSFVVGPGLDPFLDFDANRTEVERGESVVLRWSVPSELPSLPGVPVGVELHPGLGTVALVDSLEVFPTATTQYVIGAYPEGIVSNLRIRGLVLVQVADGASSLLALPMQPRVGEDFELHLTIPEDATEATLEPGFGALEPRSQTLSAQVAEPTVFTLTVLRPEGIESAELRVDPEEDDPVSIDDPTEPPVPAPTTTFRMLANVPNPFNPRTTIRFEVSRAGTLGLEIFDMRGRRVRTIDLGPREPGRQEWSWDGRDDGGASLASGAYLVRVSGPEGTVSRKVLLGK